MRIFLFSNITYAPCSKDNVLPDYHTIFDVSGVCVSEELRAVRACVVTNH